MGVVIISTLLLSTWISILLQDYVCTVTGNKYPVLVILTNLFVKINKMYQLELQETGQYDKLMKSFYL